MPEFYAVAPYRRYVYDWDISSNKFSLREETPINHYAVAGTVLRLLQAGKVDQALGHFSPETKERQGLGNLYQLLADVSDLLDGVDYVAGFPSRDRLRVRTLSGLYFDFVFDRELDEAYRARRQFGYLLGEPGNTCVTPPAIVGIKEAL